ncbi:MAG: sterol desaturase family protein [Psychromonas sp.]|nr:sterol desaturase family protein [Psychromonas sp.]
MWQFHSVHHLDNQFDCSTKFSQHFAEKIFVLPIHIAVFMLFSMTPSELAIFGVIGTLNGIFHHSRIPITEKLQGRFHRIDSLDWTEYPICAWV